MTEANRLFAEFNDRFFGSRLPRYRVVFTPRMRGFHLGECLRERRLIRFRHELTGEALRHWLLHEMIHHFTSGHGRAFQAHLARLVKQGEAWAADEIAMYQNAATWNQEMANLRNKLGELAGLTPRWSFRKVATGLAHSYFQQSGPWLLRRAPWLRAA
jgi:hypothetical protein